MEILGGAGTPCGAGISKAYCQPKAAGVIRGPTLGTGAANGRFWMSNRLSAGQFRPEAQDKTSQQETQAQHVDDHRSPGERPAIQPALAARNPAEGADGQREAEVGQQAQNQRVHRHGT